MSQGEGEATTGGKTGTRACWTRRLPRFPLEPALKRLRKEDEEPTGSGDEGGDKRTDEFENWEGGESDIAKIKDQPPCKVNNREISRRTHRRNSLRRGDGHVTSFYEAVSTRIVEKTGWRGSCNRFGSHTWSRTPPSLSSSISALALFSLSGFIHSHSVRVWASCWNDRCVLDNFLAHLQLLSALPLSLQEFEARNYSTVGRR